MQTVMPPLTPPGWTSLITGQRPGRHGVFDFFQKDSPDTEFFRLSNSLDIHTDTIWSLASAAGRRVISLNFPMMFPAPPVNGYVVPGGWMPWKQLRLGCHPRGLFDRLKELPSFEPRELSLDMELEAKAVDGCPDEEYADWIALHIRREQRWFEIMRHLLETESPELVGVVFDGVDKLQHLVWRFLDPALRPAEPTAWEAEMTALCESYFRNLDEIIGELVELAGPEATVVFGSDHGFGPTDEVFYVNTWLEQNGYLAWADDVRRPPTPTGIGFDEMTRHIHTLDWSRTARLRRHARAARASTSWYANPAPTSRCRGRAATRSCARLPRTCGPPGHPVTGKPIADFVVDPRGVVLRSVRRLRAGRFDHAGGWLVDLHPALGGRVPAAGRRCAATTDSTASSSPPGPGVRRVSGSTDVSILDVTPFILHALGVPQPDGSRRSRPATSSRRRRPGAPATYATVPAAGAAAGGHRSGDAVCRGPRRCPARGRLRRRRRGHRDQPAAHARLRGIGFGGDHGRRRSCAAESRCTTSRSGRVPTW